MDRFEQLKALAGQIGAAESVSEYESRCASIGRREHTGVVITGMPNSGKTTILNGITGVSLREPSNIPDSEPPLRVAFERMEPLDGFDCRTVMNRQWNSEAAILYEIDSSDLLDKARQSRLADLADVVFYVVSALSPFTREDTDAIKALSALPVQVVLNKLNLIREEERQKVADYTAGFCAKLGIAAPLVIRENDWDAVARTFRDTLPISPELARHRVKHTDGLYREAVKSVMTQAQRQLDGLSADTEAARIRQAREELELRRIQAEWKVLKAEMLETGAAHCAALRETIMARKETVAGKLLNTGKASGFSEKWFDAELANQMRSELDAIAEDVLPRAEAFMRSDCGEMLRRATCQGLADAQAVSRIDLDPLTRIGIDSESSAQLHDAIQEASAQTVRADRVAANMNLLIGTAAACALVYLISPSAFLTFVPAGIGGVMLGIDGQSRKTVEWSKALDYYTDQNLRRLSDVTEEAIREYYDVLAETIVKMATPPAAAKENADNSRREEEQLAEVIRICRALLENA